MKQPPAHAIAEVCAAEFGLEVEDLYDRRRSEPIATARGIAMFVMMGLLGFTGKEAGKPFSRCTHDASHYTRKIRWQIANGMWMRERVKRVCCRLPEDVRGEIVKRGYRTGKQT